MNNFLSKIALGSAQWGLNYGVSNQYGQSSLNDVFRILEFARQSSIDLIDTAQLYGDSETIISQAGHQGFRIVSKISLSSVKCLTPDQAKQEIVKLVGLSLENLRSPMLYGLLVHDVDTLLKSRFRKEIVQALLELRSNKFVRKIGVSVYNRAQIEGVLCLFKPDMLQVPLNVFDQRLLEDCTLKKLSLSGIEIHARSLFLQGLLLMDVSEIPHYFSPWSGLLSDWSAFCTENGVSRLQACLSFASSIPWVSQFVLGVQNRDQLAQIVDASSVSLDFEAFSSFSKSDKRLLNPSLWQLP